MSKIEEVFCGFACYTSEGVLLDARSQPENQSPLVRRVGSTRSDEAEGAGRKAVMIEEGVSADQTRQSHLSPSPSPPK